VSDDRFARDDEGPEEEPHRVLAEAAVQLVLDERGNRWRILSPVLSLSGPVVCNHGLHSDDWKARDRCDLLKARALVAPLPGMVDLADAAVAESRRRP